MQSQLAATALRHRGLGTEDRADRRAIEQSRVSVREGRQFFAFNALADEGFDGFGEVEFIRCQESKGFACGFCSTRSADAVDIVLRVFRHTVIDDVSDARDVNATSGDIRCDEKFEGAFSEALESFHALFLRDIRVHDGDLVFVAVAVEESEYLVSFTARSREDHEGMEVRVFEKSQKELVTLFHGHRVEGVADGFSDFLASDGD